MTYNNDVKALRDFIDKSNKAIKSYQVYPTASELCPKRLTSGIRKIIRFSSFVAYSGEFSERTIKALRANENVSPLTCLSHLFCPTLSIH